jgi:hypothetical protein
MKIAYYALGGGSGHVVRGLAVLAALRRRHPYVAATLLAPGRAAPWARGEDIPFRCPPEECRDRQRLGAWIGATLDRLEPELLLVDVFPRGVLGELADILPRLATRPWLISRWVRPDYYLVPAVRRAVETCYAGLIWCEEPPSGLDRLDLPCHRVGPVLIRRPASCLDPVAARAELAVPIGVPLVLALASGDRQHQQDLVGTLAKVRRRLAGRGDPPSLVVLAAGLEPRRGGGLTITCHFPAMEVLPAADVVVAAGGYNACWETRALGLPTVFIPQQRPYDDQFRRTRGDRVARSPEELELLLTNALAAAGSAASRPSIDGTGADQVADLVLTAVEGRMQ